ncbi:hypothetical protein [Streptomyces sp. NPDC058335]|uniref:hypothetical protein n=1 Tax=Streptomyces sp. NPDC058335 TaxID=3346451 RepID=UPI0036543C36
MPGARQPGCVWLRRDDGYARRTPTAGVPTGIAAPHLRRHTTPSNRKGYADRAAARLRRDGLRAAHGCGGRGSEVA